MDPDALLAEYGPLRVIVLAELLRGLDPDRPQTAEAVAQAAGARVAPVTPALVQAVADAIGVVLADGRAVARATFHPPVSTPDDLF
jgi:hypothetical protein